MRYGRRASSRCRDFGPPNDDDGGHRVGIAITARGLNDYAQMFDLDDAVLGQNSFLDCASGASTFGAQVRLRGGTVISLDPAYSQDAEIIRGRVETYLAGARSWLMQQDDAINWDYLGSPDAYVCSSTVGLDLFTYDFTAHPCHYVAGALPRLPLPDNAVDIALCANFLFAYSESSDATETASAIGELTRVARSHVLVHPIRHRSGAAVQYLETVLAQLSAQDVHVDIWTPAASWLLNAQTLRVTCQ
jgi:hypothetical protein